MDNSTITLLATSFAVIVSATMWVDYFRRIDVFKREKIGPLIIALLIGCLTPAISLYFYSLLYKIGFHENGEFINDILYSIIGVGLNEELSKIIGVIFVLTIFRKRLDEPIDIFIFAGVTAIGFAMIENFKYFSLYGIRIITPRTFYSSLEHIINTTIIVYGFYRYKIFKKGNHYINILVSVSLAIASHGLFDFFLIDGFLGYFTVFISIIIYLFGINFWIQMLNNANNYSKFFDYDKIHFNENIFFRLLFWYSLTVLITFVNNFFVSDLKSSIIYFILGLLSDGFLFLVVMLSASRFKIYKLKYINVTIQFPFYVTRNNDEDFMIPFINLPIKIRGENFKEHIPTKYIDKNIVICPVNKNNSFLKNPVNAIITNKYLLFDDVVVYSVSFDKDFDDQSTLFLLKPKTRGKTKINGFPIQGLYKVNDENKDISTIKLKSLTFLELIYIKY
ncbi:MAG: PrsW family glutamic-type intramembrane protease [Bacteroidota bacterium]|nr:PrsW family glutamic-type intramembrane protease [Bacteroidota bacterium]